MQVSNLKKTNGCAAEMKITKYYTFRLTVRWRALRKTQNNYIPNRSEGIVEVSP